MYYNGPTAGFKPEIQKSGPAPDVNPLPFSALPHALRRDPRLKGNQTAIVLAATLLEYARNQPSCYPTNSTLAENMGVCVTTVRNALTALVRAGWIRLELGPVQPNGRTIWLCWRETNSVPQMSDTHQSAAPDPQPAAPTTQPVETPAQQVEPPPQPPEPHTQPVAPKLRNSREENEQRNVVLSPQSHIQATSTPATTPLKPLKEELRDIPGATPDRVRKVAWRLGHHLQDVHSVPYYMGILAQVAGGGIPVERLLAAFTAAERSIGGVRKSGSIFVTVFASYQPKPLPSQIRYYQTPTQPSTTTVNPGCSTTKSPQSEQGGGTASAGVLASRCEEDRKREIRELEIMANDARHPFQRVAAKRLLELGIDLAQVGAGGDNVR